MAKTTSTTALIGDEILIANLSVLEKDMNKKVAKAMKDFGDEVARVSVKRTPVDSEELRSRVFVEGPLLKGGEYFVIVGYEKHTDTFEVEYAVPVHECIYSTRGKLIKHKPGTGAKFLERTIDEKEGEYQKFMQKEIRMSRLK